MTDTTIEVACAITEASRHLNFALDQFCAVNILAAYPQAEQIELQIQAALQQLRVLAATAIDAAASTRAALQCTAAPGAVDTPQSADGGTISACSGRAALECAKGELEALYALSAAALDRLEPDEGQPVAEMPQFFAYQLVKVMHERLERTNHIDTLRALLAPVHSQPIRI
jgi:hypothetical protein